MPDWVGMAWSASLFKRPPAFGIANPGRRMANGGRRSGSLLGTQTRWRRGRLNYVALAGPGTQNCLAD